MSESSGGAEFRRPFGENKISKSEVALAGNSFRKMTKDLYASTSLTRERLDDNVLVRELDLRVEDSGMNVRLHQQVDMETGHVTREAVDFYEAGETDKDWGPKICSYIAGDGGPEVSRYDEPNNEQRKLVDEKALDLGDVIEGRNLEIAMGLNGVAIGIEEVSDLRDLLLIATPIPSDTPEK